MENISENVPIRTNKFYKASGIVSIVFASISLAELCFVALCALVVLILDMFIYSSATISTTYMMDEIAEVGTQAAVNTGAIISVVFLVLAFVLIFAVVIPATIMSFICGAKFLKFSKRSSEEASKNFGKSLAWVIISFVFSGGIVGGLAVGGLITSSR